MASADTVIGIVLPPTVARSHGRWFFPCLALVVLVAVFVGFARSYYLSGLFQHTVLPRRVQIHGALFTAWVLLFTAQTFFVAQRRVALHRKLGTLGALLIVPMLASGLAVAIAAARGDGLRAQTQASVAATMASPLVGLVIPFTSVLLFTGFAAAGLLVRHQPGRHKRLMALATMAMLPPALGRAFFWLFGSTNPLWFFGATVLVIVALAIHDRRTLGHTHPVTLWGGLLLAASFPGRLALGYTDAWSRFAHWLTG